MVIARREREEERRYNVHRTGKCDFQFIARGTTATTTTGAASLAFIHQSTALPTGNRTRVSTSSIKYGAVFVFEVENGSSSLFGGDFILVLGFVRPLGRTLS